MNNVARLAKRVVGFELLRAGQNAHIAGVKFNGLHQFFAQTQHQFANLDRFSQPRDVGLAVVGQFSRYDFDVAEVTCKLVYGGFEHQTGELTLVADDAFLFAGNAGFHHVVRRRGVPS